MFRTIVIFGLIAGLIVAVGSTGTIAISGGHESNLFLGYLVMLVALSAILVGVKSYRDQSLGGVIRFRTALGIGLGIAVVASIAYVVAWEIYLAATHYSFMAHYTAVILEKKRAAGVTGAEYEKAVAQMDAMQRMYANPLYRLAETFFEIFPVGLLIALVSAGLLRNPRFLPARSRAAAA